MTYCLTLGLAAPVAASDPYIHLDSFVAFAAGVESIGRDGLADLEEGGDPEYFAEEMPFDRYEIDGEWVWATSAAGIAHPETDGGVDEPERWNTTRWRSRFDHDPDHQIKQTQVNVSSGEFKSYNAALPYTAADTLTFYFEGDPDRTKELIEAHVPAIGKKRSQGFGVIRDVSVEDVGEAVESALYHNGRILRSLPTEFAPTVVPGVKYEQRTVRPPYWHMANKTMAVPPFVDLDRDALADDLVNSLDQPEVVG
jgi:CRISPR type IV-associated protein Csf3